jgi:transcriptional regulator with XRE-family HTH domain
MQHIVTEDIGGRLRSAREHRGMSLRDVATRTKLTIPVVRAIERNDFTALPGGMFRKAYVRTLAVEVGLNPNDIAADYCASFEPPVESLSGPSRGTTREEQWLDQLSPSPRRFLGTLVAVAVLATAWLLLDARFRSASLDNDALNRPAAITPPLAPTAAANNRPGHVPLRIELTAAGWCWVAADTDGKRSMYRLVEPGERLVLEAHRVISLRIGDAGAMTLSINDGPRRLAGGGGEVVELTLTPDNVEAMRDSAVETESGD